MGETYIVYHRVCRPIGYRHGRYFGYTRYEADVRLDRMYADTCRKHRRKGYFSLTRMERALWKFGPASFDTVVIERDADRAHCLALESWHQVNFNTIWPNGLNTVSWAPGGHMSDEARAKLSASMREAFRRPEVRAKMSASLRRVYERPDVRASMSASVKTALTPEVRAKMSVIKRAQNPNPAPSALRRRAVSDAQRVLRRVRELQAGRFVPDPLIARRQSR